MDTNKRSQLKEDLMDHMVSTTPLPDAMEDEDFDFDQKTRKSCCLIFSLQTGVLLIFSTDLMIFVLLVCMTGMTLNSMSA